jgi:hypothetical protein
MNSEAQFPDLQNGINKIVVNDDYYDDGNDNSVDEIP